MTKRFFRGVAVSALGGLLLAASATFLGCKSTVAAPASFEQATKDYAAGRYSLALSEFDAFKAAYPNNIMVHYYCGLCSQALNKLGQAKAEYEFVAKYDTGRLKPLALAALAQFGKLKGTQIAMAPSGGGSAASSSAGGNGAPQGAPKIKKVLEFYADW